MLIFATVFAIVQVAAFTIGHSKGKHDGLHYSVQCFRKSASVKFEKHMRELRLSNRLGE